MRKIIGLVMVVILTVLLNGCDTSSKNSRFLEVCYEEANDDDTCREKLVEYFQNYLTDKDETFDFPFNDSNMIVAFGKDDGFEVNSDHEQVYKVFNSSILVGYSGIGDKEDIPLIIDESYMVYQAADELDLRGEKLINISFQFRNDSSLNSDSFASFAFLKNEREPSGKVTIGISETGVNNEEVINENLEYMKYLLPYIEEGMSTLFSSSSDNLSMFVAYDSTTNKILYSYRDGFTSVKSLKIEEAIKQYLGTGYEIEFIEE